MNMPMHIHYKALHNLQNQQKKNKSKLQETKHNYKKRKNIRKINYLNPMYKKEKYI